ncbi:MAG: glucose-1-phosphate thymidylyltransferase [Flavobacteriales bacterium]|nr:glucose-1-phosphate thymidylyltransferase [Flavobacteriales bacterium]
MNVILFDIERENLYPLTFTRPISDFRVGIVTIKEKWEFYFSDVSVQTEDYLSEKFPIKRSKENLWINSSVLPNDDVITEISSLRKGEILVKNEVVIAINNHDFVTDNLDKIECNTSFNKINDLWDIFSLNGEEIKTDFKHLVLSKHSENLLETNTCFGEYPIFIEKGSKVNCAILNSNDGPIYIGKNAEVMEGSIIRGPFAMCNNSTLKMGSKIYGPTTLGPYCKVGGEVNNSVFFGYSSKSHDGFLGNSVIGEWCNLGADTNNSNLKNNYDEVKLWNYEMERFKKTGLQFCGLIMADHSKCGINTMFNTGTVVGVSANIFGSGFPRNIIPSFSWGGNSGFTTYKTNKVFEVAEIVMKRRNIEFTDVDKSILNKVFELTSKYRNY